MECDCAMDCDFDGESPDFSERKMVKARKKHTCSECGQIIIKGTEYELIKGCWNGVFHTNKTCPDCLSMREVFFNTFFFGAIWGDMWMKVVDVGGDIPESCISQLTPVARDKVCDLIEEVWGDMSYE